MRGSLRRAKVTATPQAFPMKFLPTLLSTAALLAAPLPAAEFHVDQADEFARLVPPGAKVAKLAGDMGFIEGPVWVKTDGGHLVFSDIPNNELKRWSAPGASRLSASRARMPTATPSISRAGS